MGLPMSSKVRKSFACPRASTFPSLNPPPQIAEQRKLNSVSLPTFTEGCDSDRSLDSADMVRILANRTVQEEKFFFVPEG